MTDSIETLIEKSNNNDTQAQNDLGIRYYLGTGIAKDYKKAAELFKLASEKGHVQSLCSYGLMLAYGRGTEKNEKEAVRLYKIAAEKGSIQAHCNYGWMLENGLGTEKNEQEAVKQYKFAAEKGHPQAQFQYGLMLANGRGTEKNESEAIKQFQLAAEQGHNGAQLKLTKYPGAENNLSKDIETDISKATQQSATENKLKTNVETDTPEVTQENSMKNKLETNVVTDTSNTSQKSSTKNKLKTNIKTDIPKVTQESSTVPSNPDETEFEKEKLKIKASFVAKLDTLHTELSTQAKSDADTLLTDIKTALDSLFEKLTRDTKDNEIQEHFKIFKQTCSTHASKADAVMGHGWLFRAVEVLGKAIGALFVGMGMAVGSIFLQGFAKESHRNWYKDTFFTPHQTEASKTIKSLDQDIEELGSELKVPKK